MIHFILFSQITADDTSSATQASTDATNKAINDNKAEVNCATFCQSSKTFLDCKENCIKNSAEALSNSTNPVPNNSTNSSTKVITMNSCAITKSVVLLSCSLMHFMN